MLEEPTGLWEKDDFFSSFFPIKKLLLHTWQNIPPTLFHGLPSSSCCCKAAPREQGDHESSSKKGAETPEGQGTGGRCRDPPVLHRSCHKRGCGGPRDPSTLCLEVEKEVALAALGRLCKGRGQKKRRNGDEERHPSARVGCPGATQKLLSSSTVVTEEITYRSNSTN